jgi:hypothetical protein
MKVARTRVSRALYHHIFFIPFLLSVYRLFYFRNRFWAHYWPRRPSLLLYRGFFSLLFYHGRCGFLVGSWDNGVADPFGWCLNPEMAWRIIRWDGWERGDGDAEYVKYDSVLYYCVVPLPSVPARLHRQPQPWLPIHRRHP